jgi:predicted alpha/beta superfamily hydrolase
MKTASLLLFFSFFISRSFAQKNTKDVDKSVPMVIGLIQKIPSTALGEERKISVYLPEDYNQNDTTRYPVIYILDGGVNEDFIHIAGIVRFNTQPWINRFPKSIVVGIENTNRKRDFSFAVPNLDFVEKMGFNKKSYSMTGGSSKYISFLEKELQPYISRTYKTTAQKTVIGESFAGLLATEILLKHRDLFSTYIIITPSLWWGNESLLVEAPKLLKSGNNSHIKVYVGACDKAEEPTMYNDAATLAEVLKQDGVNFKQVHFDYMPNEIHSTAMHQAVYNAFKLLYPKTEYQK